MRSRTSTDLLLVTGATGHVGGTALRLLSTRLGVDRVAALARNAERAARAVPPGVAVRIADYDDTSALAHAFEGVSRLLFVAGDGRGLDLIRQHANVIDAAAASGIEHIVFTSIVDVAEDSPFYFAPVYRDAERRLAGCGKAWTILRCGLYADFLHSHWLAPARSTGRLVVPAGRARVAAVSRDDVAAAAAAVMTCGGHRGEIHALTGPRAHAFDEIAEAASRIGGAAIRYQPCPPTDYLQGCWATMDDPWPHAFSTLFAAIGQGRYAATCAGVQALTGRPPEDLDAFLARIQS